MVLQLAGYDFIFSDLYEATNLGCFKVVVSSHCVPCGKYLFKFSADMNRLAAHGSKHSNLSGKDAVRAVIVKASSKALHAVPSVCGHIINGYFYPCANRGVSLIVPLSTSMRSGAISINNADSLSTRQIANVIKQETASVNVDCSVSGFPAKFPFWVGLISNSYVEVCSRLRMTLPGFGGNFPGGVIALLIASDSSGNTLEGKSRQRVEEALILDGALAAAPISVCIGQPTAAVDLSNRKDLQVRNECVVTVTLDTRLAAAAQCEQFAEKMILYLSTPTLLDA